jgi:hypothetical protein
MEGNMSWTTVGIIYMNTSDKKILGNVDAGQV